MLETARQKEQEMLDRIADAEMARRLRDEEEAKREEEEMAAQERFEVGFTLNKEIQLLSIPLKDNPYAALVNFCSYFFTNCHNIKIFRRFENEFY